MLAVLTYKNNEVIWQVVDQNRNCTIIVDDLATVQEARKCVKELNQTQSQVHLEGV